MTMSNNSDVAAAVERVRRAISDWESGILDARDLAAVLRIIAREIDQENDAGEGSS